MSKPARPPIAAVADAITVFGIPNCDHVRKARAWLRAGGFAYRFHDFRIDGLQPELLASWLRHVPWDSLLNRRGPSWRRLDESRRASVTDQLSASELMLAEPVLIKRPVLQQGQRMLVGFSEPLYTAFFGPHGGAARS